MKRIFVKTACLIRDLCIIWFVAILAMIAIVWVAENFGGSWVGAVLAIQITIGAGCIMLKDAPRDFRYIVERLRGKKNGTEGQDIRQ
jgi:hypothetical protein